MGNVGISKGKYFMEKCSQECVGEMCLYSHAGLQVTICCGYDLCQPG